MSPRVDPGVSDHRAGFRPGRRAHQAVEPACHDGAEGYRWGVESDVATCFDHVHHDMAAEPRGEDNPGQTAPATDATVADSRDLASGPGESTRGGDLPGVPALTPLVNSPLG